jgi:hypothetical protein
MSYNIKIPDEAEQDIKDIYYVAYNDSKANLQALKDLCLSKGYRNER